MSFLCTPLPARRFLATLSKGAATARATACHRAAGVESLKCLLDGVAASPNAIDDIRPGGEEKGGTKTQVRILPLRRRPPRRRRGR